MKSLLKKLHQRPIGFYPVYREITGSLAGGILLSQLMYWFSKKDKYFKTDKDIMSETSLTRSELERAKKLIKILSFITVTREGTPAKTYYEINWQLLAETIAKKAEATTRNEETGLHKTSKQDYTKQGNCTTQNEETYIVKSFDLDYTKTTTESNTHEKEPLSPFNIIAFYRDNISTLQDKIKEQKSFNLLALKAGELDKILTGLQNYKIDIATKSTEKKYIKSLLNFIEDKSYLDFQKDMSAVNEWSNHGKDYDHEKEWK